MTHQERGRLRTLLACLLVPILGACVDLSRPAPDVRYYALEPATPRTLGPGEASVESPGRGILLMRPFASSAHSQDEGLVHHLGQREFESDYYHRWFRPPTAMLTDSVRTWTARSGLFEAVVDGGSLLTPTHTLEGQLLELHADFDSDPPEAVLTFGVFVLDETRAGSPLLLNREYRHVVEARGNAPGDLVAAWCQALELGLSELELDLSNLLD